MGKKVIVGMSGGVDSSVTAWMLKEQGFDVCGMYMKNWEEKDEAGACLSAREYEDVQRVCHHIGIPYYSVNFVKEYWEDVFSHCLESFKKGYTPNPDVLCNREIKFKALLNKAKDLGADYLATGHYCRKQDERGECLLLKGADPEKDQSYFLYMVKSNALQDVLFPLGHLLKSEVRELARKAALPTAEKKDSTGICFIGKRNFKNFLYHYIAPTPGDFETREGKVVGKHDGTPFYTIGQRKGLKIGGPGEAWFVVGKDRERNVVIVEQGTQHPSLFTSELAAKELTWVSSHVPAFPFQCRAKIRYRQQEAPCTVFMEGCDRARVEFLEPQRAVTPHQSIVFYQGEVCLGGGIIDEA